MIYLDNAATTPVRAEVREAMLPYYEERYGNPSGIYTFAAETRKVVEKARETVAKTLGALAEEIYFTSGGTESDNWALKSAMKSAMESTMESAMESTMESAMGSAMESAMGSAVSSDRKSGQHEGKKHLITTKMEHHAVLRSCKALEEEGYEVTYLDVDERGFISPTALENAIRPDTVMISVMYANNEVGTIQPVETIGKIARRHHILFHTDAVQAYGHLPIAVKEAGIDLLSASAHKLNGPKGVGFLYASKEIGLKPFLDGGQQENGKRAGTENVAGIVGLEQAAKIAHEEMGERERRVLEMRRYLTRRILNEIPFSRLNGSEKARLAGNCNISFQFIEGASLLTLLDMDGICASAGSACSSGSAAPSHVLTAMGIPEDIAHGTVRFSIGAQNTMEEMRVAADCIRKNVEKLRRNSPEYEDYCACQ